jgi:hypothetical protein
MSVLAQIFGGAYTRYFVQEDDAPQTVIAAVSAFDSALDRLRCVCGGEAQQFRLDCLPDGSARLVCRRCCAELATISADLVLE